MIPLKLKTFFIQKKNRLYRTIGQLNIIINNNSNNTIIQVIRKKKTKLKANCKYSLPTINLNWRYFEKLIILKRLNTQNKQIEIHFFNEFSDKYFLQIKKKERNLWFWSNITKTQPYSYLIDYTPHPHMHKNENVRESGIANSICRISNLSITKLSRP